MTLRQAQDEQGTFADLARRLAGHVPLTLGWRPGEFWSATPEELAAIFGQLANDPDQPMRRSELDALMEREAHG